MATLGSYPLPVEEMGAQSGCIALHRKLSGGAQPCMAQLFGGQPLGRWREHGRVKGGPTPHNSCKEAGTGVFGSECP